MLGFGTDTSVYDSSTRLSWALVGPKLPKLSTLCYAHAAPRQAEQLPHYTLMYAHIGRLAILHISTRTIYLYMKEEEKNVAISGIRA